MIAFIHIPKTSGTSMEQVFKDVYGEDKCFFTTKWEDGDRMLRNPELFAKYEVVGGHLPVRYFRNLPIRHFVTIFRKPIARYVSHYMHMIRTSEHPLHEMAKSTLLADFIKKDERPNEQCWYLDAISREGAANTLDVGPPLLLYGIMEDLPNFSKLLTKYLGREFPAEFPKVNVALPQLEIAPKVADDICQAAFLDVQLYNAVKQKLTLINSKL